MKKIAGYPVSGFFGLVGYQAGKFSIRCILSNGTLTQHILVNSRQCCGAGATLSDWSRSREKMGGSSSDLRFKKIDKQNV